MVTSPMSVSNFDYDFKIVLYGMGGVGKSTFLERIMADRFDNATWITSGIAFYEAEGLIQLGEVYKSVRWLLWDFPGMERFRELYPMYTQGAAGCLIFFDLTRGSTLDAIPNFINMFRETIPNPNAPILLIGMKADLQNDYAMNIIDLKKYYQENFHVEIIPASARTGQGIQEIFAALLEKLLSLPKEVLAKQLVQKKPVIVPRFPVQKILLKIERNESINPLELNHPLWSKYAPLLEKTCIAFPTATATQVMEILNAKGKISTKESNINVWL